MENMNDERNMEFYVFVPCTVIQLCNVNQQNAHSIKLMF